MYTSANYKQPQFYRPRKTITISTLENILEVMDVCNTSIIQTDMLKWSHLLSDIDILAVTSLRLIVHKHPRHRK